MIFYTEINNEINYSVFTTKPFFLPTSSTLPSTTTSPTWLRDAYTEPLPRYTYKNLGQREWSFKEVDNSFHWDETSLLYRYLELKLLICSSQTRPLQKLNFSMSEFVRGLYSPRQIPPQFPILPD